MTIILATALVALAALWLRERRQRQAVERRYRRACGRSSKRRGALVRVARYRCNTGIGVFLDDPTRLKAAIKYLKARLA